MLPARSHRQLASRAGTRDRAAKPDRRWPALHRIPAAIGRLGGLELAGQPFEQLGGQARVAVKLDGTQADGSRSKGAIGLGRPDVAGASK